jgi:cytochrome b subunit of formate dehydrogenase
MMSKLFVVHGKIKQSKRYGRVIEQRKTILRFLPLEKAIGLLTWLSILVIAAPVPAWAQKGESARMHRELRMTTGYYDDSDVTSGFYLHLPGGPVLPPGLITSSPRGTSLRWRAFLRDAHWGIEINRLEKCTNCHRQQARNIHTARSKITCNQCHGFEPIAGIYHYYSKMNPTRRHAWICAKCHEGANISYATYVVHEPNPLTMAAQREFPMLFYAFWILVAVAAGTFIVFLPHTFLWGLREAFAGPRKQGESMIGRFTLAQRLFHVSLMLSFITQAATGLSRAFIETQWGTFLASLFGGYEQALAVHKLVGLFMLLLFGIHLLYVMAKIDWRQFPQSLFGPDSLLPRWADLVQGLQHLGWFFGMKKQPQFDRWGYWEKFDYWAVFWGMLIIGGTGLILYSPVFSSRYMPGWGLNVALWVHRIEAMLAMAHVFIIHFFIGHIRRPSFPMDLAMFEGSVNLEFARHERPAWVARLEKTSKLESLLVSKTSIGLRVFFYLFGFAALIIGVFLLIGALVNSPYITW